MNTSKIQHTVKDFLKYLQLHRKDLTPARLNIVLMILVIIIATYTVAVSNNQRQLKALIEIQSAKIGELAKINKDLHTSQKTTSLSDSNNIGTLNTLVNELIKSRDDDRKAESPLNIIGDSFVLSATATAPAATVSAAFKGILMVKADQPASIYAQPSTGSPVLANGAQNTIYFYDSSQNDWYQVELNSNQKGWVQKNYIQLLPKG